MHAHGRRRMGNNRCRAVDGGAERGPAMPVSTGGGQGGRESQIAERVFRDTQGTQSVARVGIPAAVRRHDSYDSRRVKDIVVFEQ